MSPLDLVKLTGLMHLARGRPEIGVGPIDGPVAMDHPDLAAENVRAIPGGASGGCARAGSAACLHGTFVAGILSAKRDSPAPAICPDCTLFVRSIFSETTPANGHMPSATPGELAAAVVDTVQAGARVINLSAAPAQPSSRGGRELEEALDYAANCTEGMIDQTHRTPRGNGGQSPISRKENSDSPRLDDVLRLTPGKHLFITHGWHGLPRVRPA